MSREAETTFLAADWGTSRLRLFLLRAGRILDSTEGPGIASSKDAESVLFNHAARFDRAARRRIVICGMAGSGIGWKETPYVACPADGEAISREVLAFHARGSEVVLIPGVACRNLLQAPDFIRGEETQIVGALHLVPELRRGVRLVCLPGTHTKWASVEGGRISHFMTALTGELYDALSKHTILGRGIDLAAPTNMPVFDDACARAARSDCLLHRLFEVRSRTISGGLDGSGAASWLSGLLVGADIAGARRLFRLRRGAKVTVIGTPRISRLYRRALKAAGQQVAEIAAGRAAAAGLWYMHRALDRHRVQHAI